MVDMTDSKSVAGDCVRVQVSSPVLQIPCQSGEGFFFAPTRYGFASKAARVLRTVKKRARRRGAAGGGTRIAADAIAAA